MKGAEALGGDDVINNLSKHCIALAKHRNKTLYNKALIKHWATHRCKALHHIIMKTC